MLAPDVGVQVVLLQDHLATCGALSSPAVGLPLVGGGLLLPWWCGLLLLPLVVVATASFPLLCPLLFLLGV